MAFLLSYKTWKYCINNCLLSHLLSPTKYRTKKTFQNVSSSRLQPFARHERELDIDVPTSMKMTMTTRIAIWNKLRTSCNLQYRLKSIRLAFPTISRRARGCTWPARSARAIHPWRSRGWRTAGHWNRGRLLHTISASSISRWGYRARRPRIMATILAWRATMLPKRPARHPSWSMVRSNRHKAMLEAFPLPSASKPIQFSVPVQKENNNKGSGFRELNFLVFTIAMKS